MTTWEGRIVSRRTWSCCSEEVSRKRERLDHASGVVELTQTRFETASTAYDEAIRERKRVKTALRLAQRRAERLAKEAKRAKTSLRAAAEDRDDADSELSENISTRDKRQAKLVKAEAALAAAEATATVQQEPAPAKKAAPATKRAPATKAATTKAGPARKGSEAHPEQTGDRRQEGPCR